MCLGEVGVLGWMVWVCAVSVCSVSMYMHAYIVQYDDVFLRTFLARCVV